jgi:SsrA-binding protein
MKILAENKKAYFEYDILEKYQAGLVLQGPEVKSAKNGHINLTGGYAVANKNGEVWLINCLISPYPPAGLVYLSTYEDRRSRKLLLKKKEINYLIGKSQIKGYALIPLKAYLEGIFIKIEIGLGRGKKQWNKKETIKDRETKRDMRRAMREKA